MHRNTRLASELAQSVADELRQVCHFNWDDPEDFDLDDLPHLADLLEEARGQVADAERIDGLRELLTELVDGIKAEEAGLTLLKPMGIAGDALLMLDEEWRGENSRMLTERRGWVCSQWRRRHRGKLERLKSVKGFAQNQEPWLFLALAERLIEHVRGEQASPPPKKSSGAGDASRAIPARRSVVTPWPVPAKPEDGQDVVVLLASQSIRQGPGSGLVRLVREFEPLWRKTKPIVYAVEGAYKEIWRSGLLHDYADATGTPRPDFVCLKAGRDGGLVYATELVVASAARRTERGGDGSHTCVIYLMDPRDPAALYPETAGLKRECLMSGTTFLNSYGSAARWLALEWAVRANGRRPRGKKSPLMLDVEHAQAVIDALPEHDDESVVLAAHDRHKLGMLQFATDHAEELTTGFDRRFATESTGHLLNGGPAADIERYFGRYPLPGLEIEDVFAEIAKLQSTWLENRVAETGLGQEGWVDLLTHGRHGGVIQLARKVLERECSTVVFFQDGETPREHDMDIEVLDRATQMEGSDCLLIYDEQTATRWARNRELCREQDQLPDPLTLVDAYRMRYGVELVLAHAPDSASAHRHAGEQHKQSNVWDRVVETASTHVLGLIHEAVRRRRLDFAPARIGFSWGGVMRDIVGKAQDESKPGWLASAIAMRDFVERTEGPRLHHLKEGTSTWPPPASTPLPDSGIRKDDLRLLPTVGLVGSIHPEFEAHAIADRAAQLLGGEAVNYPEFAFQFSEPDKEPDPIEAEWDELDVLVCNCDVARQAPGERLVLPDRLYEAVEGSYVFGTIYVKSQRGQVAECDYGSFRQTGISFEQVQQLVRRKESEVVLVAGADKERQEPALAALRAGLVSMLVTDPGFAWAVLDMDLKGALG